MSFERSWVEIDLDNFSHNLQQLKQNLSSHTRFMQIVKADAYGHGAYEIALRSLEEGAVYLGVANGEEGALLRYQNVEAPILILSPSYEKEIGFILENQLTPTINSYEFAQRLNTAAENKAVNIHLEIDTGMGRSGIKYDEAVEVIEKIKLLPNLIIEGLFSHYASSESDREFTKLQSERFKQTLDRLSFKPKYIHIANSAGSIINSPEYANLVRLGLMSYGVYPSADLETEVELKSVMSFKSSLCQIKTVNKGDSIGYNRTYIADRETKYGIIPVGYADGYDYLLSNRSLVRIRDGYYPVIGKVSMDMLAVDLTGTEEIKVGDEVVLLDDDRLRPEKLVNLYNGLSYELISQIGRRARRYYKQQGEIVAKSPLARREFVSRDFSDSKLNLIIESAISQRLQSKEIASLLYSEVLRRFFVDRDKDIHYRKNFSHKIYFSLPVSTDVDNYYEVNTTLTFSKILQQNYFYVACANKMENLQNYFRRRDVEYRWLLDDNFSLTDEFFSINRVMINDIILTYTNEIKEGCMEIYCSHPDLKPLVGTEVDFSISTKTYYPKEAHQLAVYVTEMTKGIDISFHYPADRLSSVEVVNIFSGQSKYPQIYKEQGKVRVHSEKEEWIFPNSGVVFAY